MPAVKTESLPASQMPIGAEIVAPGLAHFRVWAPDTARIEVAVAGKYDVSLHLEEGGYFSGTVPAQVGDFYGFRIDGGSPLPDPASRFQPKGPHGLSQLIDPWSYRWTDQSWRGVAHKNLMLYEMHIGTFTPDGTWCRAIQELEELANLGITMIEVMPVAEFPGQFGWGYDGVNLFAPTHLYGNPDDFRAFVNRAHTLGMGVILDVVYNHFGPDGNYLKAYTKHYFTDRYKNEWGEAINFDGPQCGPVREFFISNACYWIKEFHLDGLRLDATQQIFDSSEDHILRAMVRKIHQAAEGRTTFVVAENETQDNILLRPESDGGHGLDSVWNDDFHHSAMVALTGKNPAYYSDYRGQPQELISALKWGFLYQGQYYPWQKKNRGTPTLDIDPQRFVLFLQNHDQVANSGQGSPLNALTSPGRLRAMTALMLLAPSIPMLFQGQEFASTKPFYYFADHHPELAKLVAEGRCDFLSQFPELALPASQNRIANPADRQTFLRSKLDLNERQTHAPIYRLHRDLLQLRKHHPVFNLKQGRNFDGAVLGEQAFVLRYFVEDQNDRLLLVNLGRDLYIASAPEPLLAPPLGKHWILLWTSDDVCYGGNGTCPPRKDGWFLPGEATIVMTAQDL